MMSKPTSVLFGILTIVAIVTIAPHVFAATTQVQMSPGAGSDQSCVAAKNCFDPNVVNIAVGDTVTWTNNDKVGHTTTSGLPTDNQTGTVWDSSLVKAGGTYSFTFQTAGDYKYFCMVHPWMAGEVIVGAVASSPSGSTGSTSSSMNTNSPAQSGQGQQGGIPLGSSYNAPASNPQPSAAPPVSTGATYNDSDNPYGPLSGMAWAAGLAIAAVLSGIGVWTAVRRR
jgi:plastocyanin